METMQFTCILPSAGCGTRISPMSSKQLDLVLGRPLFLFTVDSFLNQHNCGKVLLVVPPEQHQHYEDLLKSGMIIRSVTGGGDSFGRVNPLSKVLIVEGSTSRHRSIAAAKQTLEELNLPCRELIVVHDVVRPFMDSAVLDALLVEAEKHGAAGVSRPLASTVVKCDPEWRLVEALDRASHQSSETPQAFRWDVFSAMYDQCSTDDLNNGTECLALAQKYTRTAASLVAGSDVFWKITYPRDQISARCLLNSQNLQQLYLVVKSQTQSRFFSQLLAKLFNDIHEIELEDLLDRNPDRLLKQSQTTFLFAPSSPGEFTACLDACVSLSSVGSIPWSGLVFLIVTRLMDLTKGSYLCLKNAIQLINNSKKGNWLGLVCYEEDLVAMIDGSPKSSVNGPSPGQRFSPGSSPSTSRRSSGSKFTQTKEVHGQQSAFGEKAMALIKDLIENRTLSSMGSVHFLV